MASFTSLPRSRSAFTILELLVVITIIGILTVILIPVGNGILRSYQMNTGVQTVLGQLNMARQSALTKGRAVQVRLYYLPDFGTDSATSSPAVYRGIQCFMEGESVASGTNSTVPLTALTKPVYLNAPVIALNDTNRSTLLGLPKTTPGSTEKLGQYGVNYKYVSFRFRPSGKTDLATNTTGVTFVLKNDPIGTNGVPSNFRTLEIDPRNGTVRKFQP